MSDLSVNIFNHTSDSVFVNVLCPPTHMVPSRVAHEIPGIIELDGKLANSSKSIK